MVDEKLLNRLMNQMVDDKSIYSAVLCVENSDRSFSGTTNQINGKGHRLASSAMVKIIKSVL